MTRINLVLAKKLTDQHLMAEYRELPRIESYLHKSCIKLGFIDQKRIPKTYVLGTGHVYFFYNKLNFLLDRYNNELVPELLARNYDIAKTHLSFNKYNMNFCKQIDYQPTEAEILISQARINEKIKAKPGFYKYYGKPLTKKELKLCT